MTVDWLRVADSLRDALYCQRHNGPVRRPTERRSLHSRGCNEIFAADVMRKVTKILTSERVVSVAIAMSAVDGAVLFGAS